MYSSLHVLDDKVNLNEDNVIMLSIKKTDLFIS